VAEDNRGFEEFLCWLRKAQTEWKWEYLRFHTSSRTARWWREGKLRGVLEDLRVHSSKTCSSTLALDDGNSYCVKILTGDMAL